MKKILMVLSIMLLITGCKNQLKCTKTSEEEGYKFEQSFVFNIGKNKKVKSMDSKYIMIFEKAEDAKNYFKLLNNLGEDYNISQKKNKIIIKDTQDYSKFDQSKDNLKENLEKEGYSCR